MFIFNMLLFLVLTIGLPKYWLSSQRQQETASPHYHSVLKYLNPSDTSRLDGHTVKGQKFVRKIYLYGLSVVLEVWLGN